MTISPERPLEERLIGLRASGRRLLIPYLTSGFPAPAQTTELLVRLADAGADVIELGIPFSDPLADGPTIQRASQRAIEAGGTLAQALDALADFKRHATTPVILFSYLNPIMSYGVSRFIAAGREAGAAGVLLTDLPLGSDPELESELEESALALVRLVAPTTARARAAAIAARSQGFLYYITRTGVTGARSTLPTGLAEEVDALRRASRVPVAVGFGISSAEQASEVARTADGVVVGSAFIDCLDRRGPDSAVAFIAELRAGLDAASDQRLR